METAAGDDSKGNRLEHFDGADGARTKNGMHPLREYDNVALEATDRGQASAGAAAVEDGYGAMGPRRPERYREGRMRGTKTHSVRFPCRNGGGEGKHPTA